MWLLFIIPFPVVTSDRCDLTEVNHFLDDDGHEVFTQLIAWDWDARNSRFIVVDWRMVKEQSPRPCYHFPTREWVAIWVDGNTLREVRSDLAKESWTFYDPEVDSRLLWPINKRRKLSGRNHFYRPVADD